MYFELHNLMYIEKKASQVGLSPLTYLHYKRAFLSQFYNKNKVDIKCPVIRYHSNE